MKSTRRWDARLARWWDRLGRAKRALLGGVVLSRIILLVVLSSVDPARLMYADSRPYEVLAYGLVSEGEYEYPAWGPDGDLVRPPGYPLFIAGTYAVAGRHPLAAVLWNVLGAALTLLGTWALLRHVGGSRPAIVGLVFLLDLAWLFYSVKLMPEALFTPLLIAAVLLVLRSETALGADVLSGPARGSGMLSGLAAGALVGVCALMKPIALYLPIVLAGFLVARRRPAAAAALALGFGLAIAPWVVRNWALHGTPAFTSLQNDNLLMAHASFVWAETHGLSHLEAQEVLFDRLEARLGHPLEGPGARRPPYARLDAARGELARDVLSAYPLTYAGAIARGMAITLFDPGRLVFANTFPQPDDPFIGLTQNVAREGVARTVLRLARDDAATVLVLLPYLAFLGLVALFAVVGVVPAFRRAPVAAALLVLVGGYLLVMGGPHGYARFRLYVFPFELVFFAFGVDAVRGRLEGIAQRRRSRRSLATRPAAPSP